MAEKIPFDDDVMTLIMGLGGPDEPIVRVGMKVNKGEPIAKAKGMGAHIHASITGTVLKITDDCIEIGAEA